MKKTHSKIISLLVGFAVLAIPLCVEAQETIIDVSPMEYDFGNVEVGQSSSMIFTITNTNGHQLMIFGLDWISPDNYDFQITSAPGFPVELIWDIGNIAEVEITYSPTSEESDTATLVVFSDDWVNPVIYVPLSGTGVLVEIPPDEQIQDILDFIDKSVDDGTLEGDGSGNSANNRLNALVNMVEATGDLVAEGKIEEACKQLMDVYNRTDAQPNPPDFVKGVAASELATMVLELMDSLGCL